MSEDHRFRITQGGFTVASGSAADRDRMLGMMSHYAVLYAQEGPIKVETRSGKSRWREHKP